MTPRILAVSAAVSLIAACSGVEAPTTTPEPPVPPVGQLIVVHPDGSLALDDDDNLVTEDELVFLAAKAASGDLAYLLVGLITGYLDRGTPPTHGGDGVEHGTPLRRCDATDYDAYTDDSYILIEVGVNDVFGDCHWQGDYQNGRVYVHLDFGDAIYSDGSVDESNCRKLPGAGTKTTGEYRELTNDTDEPVKRTISHTVEESHSEETSLTETFEESSGSSIEAGASFPGGDVKATQSFDQKFAVEHGSVASDDTTHSETVEDESEVLGGHIVAATFTLDDSATECDIAINAAVDWTWIRARVNISHCGRWCSGSNLSTLFHRHVVEGGNNKTFDLKGVDDLVRLVTGHDPRCEGCGFDLVPIAQQARDNLTDPKNAGRFVSLAGTRRYTVKDSASVVFRDITGKDSDCVHDVLTTEGVAVGDIDDRLDAC